MNGLGSDQDQSISRAHVQLAWMDREAQGCEPVGGNRDPGFQIEEPIPRRGLFDGHDQV
jgi:hypothetical protein